jgi:hypothetical protein
MKKFILRLTMLLVAAGSSQAIAHGDEQPQYGGVVRSVKEVAYELAPHSRGLMVYVSDHGNPLPTAGITGKLVLVNGMQRTEVALEPAGGNALLAGGLQLAAGQRAIAVLAMPSGRSVVIQFPPR